MENILEIKALALLRLEEARILAASGKPDGAFYLGGYSIELSLKAKAAERLGVTSLFAAQTLPDEHFPDIGELRRLLKTHNLTLLLVMSGLRPAYNHQKTIEQQFLKFDDLLRQWSEQLRYQPTGNLNAQEVTQFLDFLAAPDGLLAWIDKH